MTDEQSIREIARHLLATSKNPDPRALARRLAMRLSIDQREDAVIECCSLILQSETRIMREVPTSTTVGRSRWSTARERFPVAGGWKFLDNCTYEDLLSVADQYAARAAANANREREVRELAEELRRSGYATVGEMRAAREQVAA